MKKCPLCNCESVFQLKLSKKYKDVQYLHCPECDLIFVPEKFHLSLKDEAARYILHENSLLNEGYVNMFLEIISLIRKYCPDLNSVLDYGCGYEPVLAELFKKDGLNCDIYDSNFFPRFPERSYDLVIVTEVFEHFRNPGAELDKINSLINPSGYLAIRTSFHNLNLIEYFENWWYITDPTHICFLSIRTFEWISRELDMEIIYNNDKNFIILSKQF